MKRPLPLLLSLVAQFACASAADEDATASVLAAEARADGIWQPRAGASWDWQLTPSVDTRADVDIYDLDVFTITPELVQRLHAADRKVVCYVNVGAWEQWRPDAAQFPAEVLGKAWSATRFTDERWLDVRRIDVLRPLLGARFDMAKRKGCDAVEPDNLDGYDDGGARDDRTGFDLTYEDQLKFNRFIAAEVHQRGMAVALKNDPHQAADLVDDFDFVVSEQCFDYDECKYYAPFARAKKAILLAEYQEDLGPLYQSRFARMCDDAPALGISAILKKNKLDSWRRDCDAPRPAAPRMPDAGVGDAARPRAPRSGPGIGWPSGGGRIPGIGRSPGAGRDRGVGGIRGIDAGMRRDAGAPPGRTDPDAGT